MNTEQIRKNLHYLIRLRWVIIFILLLLGTIYKIENHQLNFFAFFLIISSAIAMNLSFHFILNQIIPKLYYLWIHFAFDAAVITSSIYLTGGVESFFVWVFFILIILYGTIFDLKTTLVLASFISIIFSLFLYQGAVKEQTFHVYLVNILVFYFLAFLSGYSMSFAKKHNPKIWTLNEELDRLEKYIEELNHISGEMNAILEEDKLFKFIRGFFISHFNIEEASILVESSENPDQIVERKWDETGKHIDNFVIDKNEVATLECKIYSGEEIFKEKKNHIGEFTHVLPLVARDSLKGFILFRLPRDLKAGEEDFLCSISKQIVITLEREEFYKIANRLTQDLGTIPAKELNDILKRRMQELSKHLEQRVLLITSELEKVNSELRRKIKDFHNLFYLSKEMNTILDLEKLLNSLLIAIMDQIQCYKVGIFFQDPEFNGAFSLQYSKGFSREETVDLVIKKNSHVHKFLLKSSEPVEIEKLRNFRDEYISFLKLCIDLIIPISVKEKLIGIVILASQYGKKQYTVEEKELLTILIGQAANAIENAKLYQEVEKLSITDALTGLGNYRSLINNIKLAVRNAKRYGNSFSLLLLDIDHFKNYNDTFGHPAGDVILQSVGEQLIKSVREVDFVARYGGEEFAVILSHADRENAAILAERIRVHIEQTSFPNEEIQPNGKLTISLGIATYPEDGNKVETLLKNADEALYHAKRAGRNRIYSYRKKLIKEVE